MTSICSAPSVSRVFAVTLILAGMSARPAGAQSVSEFELKAAFVYNFAKFTEWPAESLRPGGRLVLCVNGDEGVETALAQATKNRMLNDHQIVVLRLDEGDPPRTCHILFVSASVARDRLARLVGALATVPVLTIGDRSGFAKEGGIAELFIDNGRVRFTINADAALRSQLRISSRLLTLATAVTREGGK
jgi:YfiR/HmsC-like